MIHFVVPRDTDFGIQEYLELWGRSLVSRMRVLYYDDFPECSSLPGGVYIFSALDQLLPAGLRLAAEAADQLCRAGCRVLNHPATTLRRLELLEELFRRGLNRHRAARADADPEGLRYPVFLREEHQHTGALTDLLHTPEALRAELGHALVQGLRLEDLLVVEFCDTADAEGTFRKYAAFVVGASIIPRGLARGSRWALKHSSASFTRESLDEERGFVLGNPHEARLREIFTAARTEYGRIDYALKDGVVETWEINLNPTIGRASRAPSGVIPPEMQQYRTEAREHFYRRFLAAFEALDASAEPPSIPVTYRPATLEGLTLMSRPRFPSRRFETVKRVLRPFRPLLDPVVRAMLPFLVPTPDRRPPSRGP